MTDVIVKFKVYVKDPESIKETIEKIKNIAKVQEISEQELGFGIKYLKTVLIVDEGKGIDNIETQINELDTVSQVEVESVDRALG